MKLSRSPLGFQALLNVNDGENDYNQGDDYDKELSFLYQDKTTIVIS
jgi:hypothetical protein